LQRQGDYYDDILAEAAALLESLAINHLFVDGNKRMAFAAADAGRLAEPHGD
jgi:death-on-curing protein